MAPSPVTITVPDAAYLPVVAGIEGIDVRVWDLAGPPPVPRVDLVVGMPGAIPRPFREIFAEVEAGALQLASIGYDAVVGQLPPGITVANAASVYEPATAELALALVLAAQRGLPDFVRAAGTGTWQPRRYPGLTDKRVMLVGHGGIGRMLEAMLAGFEVELVRVASRARTTETGEPVHGVDELPALLPGVDVVIVAVPLQPSTERLVDAAFLASLPDGALVVNVARGRVADTDAILAEARSGRLRFALDTTDPEPLPADHPLWALPNVLVAPHVGGLSDAMAPRLERLVRAQAERLARGEALLNVVYRS